MIIRASQQLQMSGDHPLLALARSLAHPPPLFLLPFLLLLDFSTILISLCALPSQKSCVCLRVRSPTERRRSCGACAACLPCAASPARNQARPWPAKGRQLHGRLDQDHAGAERVEIVLGVWNTVRSSIAVKPPYLFHT